MPSSALVCLARFPKDLIDDDAILEGRALAGVVIDWDLARRWAVEWGIETKLDELRARAPK